MKNDIATQHLRTAILRLGQYPADGIREASNSFIFFEGNVTLLVSDGDDRTEESVRWCSAIHM